jgi:hypothetical protein
MWLAVAAALMAPALALTVSATSQAATSIPTLPSTPGITALPSCPASTLCTFENSGYGGTRWNFAYSNLPHNTWLFVGPVTNDRISSFYANREFVTYFNRDCPTGGQVAGFEGHRAVPNLNDEFWLNGHNMNDSISAIALATSTGFPDSGPCA